MNPESFSGIHPYDPTCARLAMQLSLADMYGPDETEKMGKTVEPRVEAITAAAQLKSCPRCNASMPDHAGAGSRATACRCIPICGRCGSDEAVQAFRFGGMSRIEEWPLTKASITRRENINSKETTTSVAVVSPDGYLVDDQGAWPIQGRPNSGGWAEFEIEES